MPPASPPATGPTALVELRKPHRVAVVLPDVTVEGPDGALAREVALLAWIATLEACQRHPQLAVLEPEATPLWPVDGHFAPAGAGRAATPTDACFGPTRRDEVLRLELALATTRASAVRLHVVDRAGEVRSFDALGRALGAQVQQALAAWLDARGLAPLPRPFEAVSAEALLAAARAVAPALAARARGGGEPAPGAGGPRLAALAALVDGGRGGEAGGEARLAPVDGARAAPGPGAPRPVGAVGFDAPTEVEPGAAGGGPDGAADGEHGVDDAAEDAADDPAGDAADDLADDAAGDAADALAAEPDAGTTLVGGLAPRPEVLPGLVPRLPAPLRAAAIRLVGLALREDAGPHLLAVDPLHPQARLAALTAGGTGPLDLAALRAVIASAPGWAAPHALLAAAAADAVDPAGSPAARAPTALEAQAAAGLATLLRPDVVEHARLAAERLRLARRGDEALRALERIVAVHPDDVAAHLALLGTHASVGRVGAALAQAMATGRRHGAPSAPGLPCHPDQLLVDFAVATALVDAGRLDEGIALRASRLAVAGGGWPRQARILAGWRSDPRWVAWSYAREGAFRGDDGRAVEGFGRAAPGDGVDLALFLDALVALGREDEVALAWAHHGLGRRRASPAARLAAARALLAAGEWRRGLEELWRAQLAAPGRDEQAALARCGRLLAAAPLDALEPALADRLAAGARTLARRMARVIADFVPGAGGSAVVLRALGPAAASATPFEPARLAGFPAAMPGRAAIDALFAQAVAGGPAEEELARGDRLVDGWLEVAFAGGGVDAPAALARAAAYVAASALARYLAATAGPPTPLAGALGTVAAEALLLVRAHRASLAAEDARALLLALDGALPGVERGLADRWLAAVERSLGLDERAAGDLAGFAAAAPRVAARILGPEELAVRAAEVARLHRTRPEGWAAVVAAGAERLAWHTGFDGALEWADAVAAQLAAGELDAATALDSLLSAAYLAEGRAAGPSVHAALALFGAGRAGAAFATLCAGLGAADARERDQAAPALAAAWQKAKLDVPFEFARVAVGIFTALQAGDAARAEKLGRWAVAYDPTNPEAHRNLGLALATQGKAADALPHLVRAGEAQATQILAGVLSQAGRAGEALAVLDYASRWYARADEWLTYGGVAYAAMDNPRTVHGYARAYQLDPDAFDASQLNAYAGVLDEVGAWETCEAIARRLLRVAGGDPLWTTCAWNHLACACVGLGRFDEAEALAAQAVRDNPLPDNAAGFATTLARAQARARPEPPPAAEVDAGREPAFAALERGEHAAVAARLGDPSWRVRRAALRASRLRHASENAVAVTPRAVAAAGALLAASVGATAREAAVCRVLALEVRGQATFPREPLPALGDRPTRAAFLAEFRARGGVILGEAEATAAPFVDREVVPGGPIARASAYVALLRALAARPPAEALAEAGLDAAGYLEVARAWAAALDADPSLAPLLEAGLAGR